jgi:hypothetical protein
LEDLDRCQRQTRLLDGSFLQLHDLSSPQEKYWVMNGWKRKAPNRMTLHREQIIEMLIGTQGQLTTRGHSNRGLTCANKSWVSHDKSLS